MKILLIEDDLDDVDLLNDALISRSVAYTMETVNDGALAIDFISQSRDYPELIILDLNLPKVHGREVILRIKSNLAFKDIPLMVLTTSSVKEDISYAYEHGVDKYLFKPTNIDMINELIETIEILGKKGSH